MNRELYISETFCAVSEDARLTEYIPVQRSDQTGQILTGLVDRLMPGLDAAFVDIGRKKNAFLPLRENSQTFTGPDLHSGDRILVQIRKEETGSKGAYLTRDLTIPGSRLILMPLNRHIGVSARVQDEISRSRLLQLGRALSLETNYLLLSSNQLNSDISPAGSSEAAMMEDEPRFGLILRESALDASEENLRQELSELLERWTAIQSGSIPAVSPAEELYRDYAPRGISAIHENVLLPASLLHQLREASSRRITLPHGGNIGIDPCEAMTVIDVNSASDSGSGNRRQTVLRTNLEACREIMIQIRLRNLSGILILDMIDMDRKEDSEMVLHALHDAFQEDRCKTVIHGYTNLGLIEMTRKRTRASWQEQAMRL